MERVVYGYEQNAAGLKKLVFNAAVPWEEVNDNDYSRWCSNGVFSKFS